MPIGIYLINANKIQLTKATLKKIKHELHIPTRLMTQYSSKTNSHLNMAKPPITVLGQSKKYETTEPLKFQKAWSQM